MSGSDCGFTVALASVCPSRLSDGSTPRAQTCVTLRPRLIDFTVVWELLMTFRNIFGRGCPVARRCWIHNKHATTHAIIFDGGRNEFETMNDYMCTV